ncbi:SEC20 [Acanthosepion pharaonis]|uniref:SEC20 n=1 Tax=Acanthosepion pharaonis TaxID=158019 RepID=A0A812EJD8_ACAPH|nr:SEC20 [Sepia pharaonis]
MEAEDIHVKLCLQEIVKLDLEVQALIQDIRECGNQSLSDDASNKVTLQDGIYLASSLEDLSHQADDRLAKLRIKIKELDQLSKEEAREANRQIIQKNVNEHQQSLLITVNALRKAKLIAQMTFDRRLREEFFSGSKDVRQRKINNKEILANTASSITENLMSLNRMMSNQVKQSDVTVNTLASSSKTMTETHEEFKSMSGHIYTSKKLLTKYNRRELTDRLLIILALIFFFSTVVYIVKKRVWS